MPNAHVQITVAKNKISVNLEPADVSKKDRDEVIWQGNQDFEITFLNSPFKQNKFSGGPGRPAPSGPVQDVPDAIYKYTITSPPAVPLDPGVRVDQ
jgi:hypothetical protein